MSDHTLIEKACIECGAPFTVEARRARTVTCSPECHHERKKRSSRNHATKAYAATSGLPLRPCNRCGEQFQPYRSTSQFCGRLCQRLARQERQAAAVIPQSCHRCGVVMADRSPGLRVCDSCRVDKRRSRQMQVERERLRRFRTYGITEADYESMLAAQGHRCAICRTDTPTAKGWAIDHCHESNMVRGILCARCNSAIGLLDENPKVIADAADYVKRHLQIRIAS